MESLRNRVEAASRDFARRISQGEGGLTVARARAAWFDAEVRALWEPRGGTTESIALVAVGSWGRGMLSLGSDLDLRIVTPSNLDRDRASTAVDALLYPLWDSGASIGHQVFSVDEGLTALAEDFVLRTAMLDARLVSGSEAPLAALRARELPLDRLVADLENEAAARHERFGGTVYLLEPDLKSSPGGLRDLDAMRWLATARFALRSDVWRSLVQIGALLPREADELVEAETFLWELRQRLHVHAGRRSERLTFEAQEAIAGALSYGEGALGAELLMQDYYGHARSIRSATTSLMHRLAPQAPRRGKPVEVDLGRGLRLFDGQVTLSDRSVLQADPAIALRVYLTAAERQAPVLGYARDAIVQALSDDTFAEKLRASEEAGPLFIRLVTWVAEVQARAQQGPRTGIVLSELHDMGLLLAMIPEFRPVTGRAHHDVYHVYTVDVHSVRAVSMLAALCRGDLAATFPLATRLAAEMSRPRVTFMAALLHDVGKGYPDAEGSRKNHSASGADLCQVILPRLGMVAEEVRAVAGLTASHLSMYHTATRRDLDDEQTLSDFATAFRFKDAKEPPSADLQRESLRELYLLTVVDIASTSPTAMTSWKAKMLDELYYRTDAFLAGARSERAPTGREDLVRAVQELLSDQTSKEDAARFVEGMPARYFAANDAKNTAWHAGVSARRGAEVAHAEWRAADSEEYFEVCVVADDMPGLLARIAAAFTGARLDVLSAQVYSRTNGGQGKSRGSSEAVDTFWVRSRAQGAQGRTHAAPEPLQAFLPLLKKLCSGEADASQVVTGRMQSHSPWRERPAPTVATEVVIDDLASSRFTVIEVFAQDRPGLLYAIASALTDLGLRISSSKVNTEGNKVADIFYVTGEDGQRIPPADFSRVRERLLLAIAEPPKFVQSRASI
ncbi:MAG: [protein-PII] uridylyltransferase [Polyangiaceae bacterium]